MILELHVTEEEADSPRDVMLDLSASQKSSGFEFDDDDEEEETKGTSQVHSYSHPKHNIHVKQHPQGKVQYATHSCKPHTSHMQTHST